MDRYCQSCNARLTGPVDLPKSPAPHLLREVTIPLPDEINSIQTTITSTRDAILNLDTTIRSLLETLDDLTRKRDALHSFKAEHEAILSPIRRLPSELLADVFKKCCWRDEDTHHLESMDIEFAPLLLTRVCSGWRKVALTIPSLWADIKVHRWVTNKNFLLWQLWLERSSQLPLSVTIDDMHEDEEGSYHTLDLLMAHCSRWQYMEVHWSSWISAVLNGPNLHLPLLESAQITIEDDWSVWLRLEAFRSAPQLRTLAIVPQRHGCFRPFRTMNIPWDQLTDCNIPIVGMAQCAELLPLLVRVVTFRLFYESTSGDMLAGQSDMRMPQLTILLPSVRSFHLEVRGDPTLLCARLVLPSLYDLNVEQSFGRNTSFLQFLSRSSDHLRRLVLHFHHETFDMQVLECLAAVPRITELEIRGHWVYLTDWLIHKLDFPPTTVTECFLPQLLSINLDYGKNATFGFNSFFGMISSRRLERQWDHSVARLQQIKVAVNASREWPGWSIAASDRLQALWDEGMVIEIEHPHGVGTSLQNVSTDSPGE